jgi:hypothetical protein
VAQGLNESIATVSVAKLNNAWSILIKRPLHRDGHCCMKRPGYHPRNGLLNVLCIDIQRFAINGDTAVISLSWCHQPGLNAQTSHLVGFYIADSIAKLWATMNRAPSVHVRMLSVGFVGLSEDNQQLCCNLY